MLVLPAIRRCWWVAALVAVALLSPNRASAGCGDHSFGGFDTVTASDAPPPSAHFPAPPPARPCPCQGANCSGAPARDPLPVSSAPATPSAKDQVRCFTADDGGAPPAAFARDLTSPRPIRRASSVFHPPRLG